MAFIVERLLDGEPEPGCDPLEADAIDSLGLEQLVAFIKSEFGVALGGEDMVRRNFADVPTLAALVDAKLEEKM